MMSLPNDWITVKIKNKIFHVNICVSVVRRKGFEHGAMLFSDIEDGKLPVTSEGVFEKGSINYETFTKELKDNLEDYRLALQKANKLKVFV